MSRTLARLAALGAVIALNAFAATAWAASSSEPLFVFTPVSPAMGTPTPPPTGSLEAPCGLAVDIAGNFYVSDYYHDAVDVFNASHSYKTQLAGVDPLDGPCALAINSTGHLYVNGFHREVLRYSSSTFPPTNSTGYGSATLIDSADPTGVAVDSVSEDVYVDDRTYVAAYEPSGAPLEEAGAPLRIGLGTLGEGYGLAFNGNRLYVPDAGSQTVQVFEPSHSTTTPVLSIAGPPGGFHSLTDSAVAVDRVSGDIYVADAVGSAFTEHPETTIDVFDSTGAYKGHLQFNVVNAGPAGLAVDNSVGATQGRVYVTSGNSEGGSVYAYGPGAATMAATQPAVFSLGVSTSGTGAGSVSARAGGVECSSACQVEAPAGQELTLTAHPDPGSAFAGWTGAGCAGTGPCTVAMREAAALDAAFAALLPPPPAPAASPFAAAAATASKPEAKKHRRHKPRRHRARHRRHHHKRRSH